MRGFEPITLNLKSLTEQLDELASFLGDSVHKKEREEIAPFFKARKQLIAALGLTHGSIAMPDRVSIELGLFGDFVCDAASGDSGTNAAVLVEFEDATEYSVLKAAPQGKIKSWSPRFEHGWSQLVDWAWRLSSEGHTTDAFQRVFGDKNPSIHLLLIAGRDVDLSTRDQDRIAWRANNSALGAYRISCLTFDGVLNALRRRLQLANQNI